MIAVNIYIFKNIYRFIFKYVNDKRILLVFNKDLFKKSIYANMFFTLHREGGVFVDMRTYVLI
ncbi:hypothetical protein HMPREF1982_02494 [Clostridiales bacterium oral taxon 876 str. F0540]|nr:hypothetical protein HMPREF1982_02494 [Clostridiales bacterium oral taxon 876 str. F0540]